MKFNSAAFGKTHSLKRFLFYLALFCIINIILFLIINQIDSVHFAMIDDFYMQNLLNGAFGEYYVFFQQTNVALNALLVSLYKILPSVNWYGVFLFILLLISASFTGAVFADKSSLRIGIPVYLAAVPVYYGAVLCYFTFTTVCYGVLVGSFACLIYGFFSEDKKLKKTLFIISIVLLCIAVLLRWEAVYSAIAYAFFTAVWLLIKYRKKSFRAVLCLLIAFGVIACFFAADKAYYASSPKLSEYLEFNSVRSDLEDKAPLNYDLYGAVFEEAGWTREDVQRIREFYVSDDENLNTENMEFVYGQMEPTRYNLDKKYILSQLLSTFSDYYVYGNIWLFAALVLAWLTNKNIWTRIYILVIAALPYMFYALFIVLWRSVFRVTYPHFILSIVIMPLLINQNKLKDISVSPADNAVKPAVCLMAVMSAIAAVGLSNLFIRAKWANNERFEDLEGNSELVQQVFEQIALNPDYAFIYVPPASPLLYANAEFSIFDTFSKGYLSNSQLLGGWLARSPEYDDFKERFNLVSLPDDLLNNDKVLFVLPDGEFTRQYFVQNYGIEVEFEEVIELPYGLTACRIVSAD